MPVYNMMETYKPNHPTNKWHFRGADLSDNAFSSFQIIRGKKKTCLQFLLKRCSINFYRWIVHLPSHSIFNLTNLKFIKIIFLPETSSWQTKHPFSHDWAHWGWMKERRKDSRKDERSSNKMARSWGNRRTFKNKIISWEFVKCWFKGRENGRFQNHCFM